jgi:hypothetical protein
VFSSSLPTVLALLQTVLQIACRIEKLRCPELLGTRFPLRIAWFVASIRFVVVLEPPVPIILVQPFLFHL